MNRSALGLILVTLGCVFLFNNLGWIPNVTRYIFSWPNILLLIAIGLLVSGKPKQAVVFLLIGGFFWIQRHFHFDMSLFWPVVLIILGIAFIMKTGRSASNNTSADQIDETNIFSGSEKIFSSQAFDGGKITTIFGGSNLDLRNAIPSEKAVIDLFVLFGGVELKIPSNWNVVMDTSPIFGGVSDNRDKSVTKDGPTIRIKGSVLFGGVDIKS